MLDKEPFSFPSRRRFVYDPGISDRQLWAIGMVVVQWSMTEYFIDMSTHQLIGGHGALRDEYKRLRGFQQTVAFWETQIEQQAKEPFRSSTLALVARTKELSAQRDEVVHRMWGGGMEGMSPAAAGLPTTDAGMLPDLSDKFKTKAKEGPIPFAWKADFVRLRRLATEIAELNRSLLMAGFAAGPPYGYVDNAGFGPT